MATRLPNRLQSTASTLLLLWLSLVLAPVSFSISLFFSLTHSGSRKQASGQRRYGRHENGLANGSAINPKQRTVLVNGARMQKSLAICRTFARNGWKVVLVEEQGWGNLAASRFSNSVSTFHLLPSSSESSKPKNAGKDPRMTPYVSALVQVALKEDVDLFFPCSGAGSTGQDAVAGQILLEKTGGRVRSMIQTPELVETLHEKDKFIDLLQKLDMAAPRSEIVYSVEEAISKLQQEAYPRCILKCAAELDDIGRADMTLYPLHSEKTGEPDWDKTRKRLSNLSIPLCHRTPYILQEFIGDRQDEATGKKIKSSEWCTHATVVDGKLTAFVCCPSNDMLMTYYPASHTIVGEMALRWTSTFLYRLQKLADDTTTSSSTSNGAESAWNRDTLVGQHAPSSAGITGQFSMDFIYQSPTSDGKRERLVAIECNPRVHTAICLLVGNPDLGDALIPDAFVSHHSRKALTNGHANPLEMDEITYLSSLSLPVMEAPPQQDTDLSALRSQPPTWASSRIRFYRAKNLLQQAFFSSSEVSSSLPKSWIGHDLPARILASSSFPFSLPFARTMMSIIHPLWTASPPPPAQNQLISIPSTTRVHGSHLLNLSFDLGASAPLPPFTDPSFANDDPWPFFALYHLQWPQLLLWQLLVRRKKWSRINVSTARIFEC